jgi:quercetin dioxygenase-like cupin family protein
MLNSKQVRVSTWAGLLAIISCIGVAISQTPPKITETLKADLVGTQDQETLVHVISFAPSTTLPWHIHPDGHEILTLLEGKWTMEVEGRAARELKVGDTIYVEPNVVHRAMNDASGPTKIQIVRIKPKSKGVTENVKR